jgi:hypothetical protein
VAAVVVQAPVVVQETTVPLLAVLELHQVSVEH